MPSSHDERLSVFTPSELLSIAREELRGPCQLIDRTANCPESADYEASIAFLSSTIFEVLHANGAILVYLQKTQLNWQSFKNIFSLVRYGDMPSFVAASGRNHPSTPGWLAWCRDDYLFVSPEYDLKLSCRSIVNFAHGSDTCCICLEAILAEKIAVGLDCGHMLHSECLGAAVVQSDRPACPLCRQTFEIDAHGVIIKCQDELRQDEPVHEQPPVQMSFSEVAGPSRGIPSADHSFDSMVQGHSGDAHGDEEAMIPGLVTRDGNPARNCACHCFLQ